MGRTCHVTSIDELPAHASHATPAAPPAAAWAKPTTVQSTLVLVLGAAATPAGSANEERCQHLCSPRSTRVSSSIRRSGHVLALGVLLSAVTRPGRAQHGMDGKPARQDNPYAEWTTPASNSNEQPGVEWSGRTRARACLSLQRRACRSPCVLHLPMNTSRLTCVRALHSRSDRLHARTQCRRAGCRPVPVRWDWQHVWRTHCGLEPCCALRPTSKWLPFLAATHIFWTYRTAAQARHARIGSCSML